MDLNQVVADAIAAGITPEVEALREEIASLKAAIANGPTTERPLTKKEAAEWLGCSQRQIDYLCKEGLPHFRPGGPGGSPRFLGSEMLAWMKSRAA